MVGLRTGALEGFGEVTPGAHGPQDRADKSRLQVADVSRSSQKRLAKLVISE
jgi:hypothetical protein